MQGDADAEVGSGAPRAASARHHGCRIEITGGLVAAGLLLYAGRFPRLLAGPTLEGRPLRSPNLAYVRITSIARTTPDPSNAHQSRARIRGCRSFHSASPGRLAHDDAQHAASQRHGRLSIDGWSDRRRSPRGRDLALAERRFAQISASASGMHRYTGSRRSDRNACQGLAPWVESCWRRHRRDARSS